MDSESLLTLHPGLGRVAGGGRPRGRSRRRQPGRRYREQCNTHRLSAGSGRFTRKQMTEVTVGKDMKHADSVDPRRLVRLARESEERGDTAQSLQLYERAIGALRDE